MSMKLLTLSLNEQDLKELLAVKELVGEKTYSKTIKKSVNILYTKLNEIEIEKKV